MRSVFSGAFGMSFSVAAVFGLFALACAVCFAAHTGQAGERSVKYVTNFTEADVEVISVSGARAEWVESTEEGAVVEGVAEKAEAVRAGAMHLVLQPGAPSSVVEYSAADGMPADWSGFDILALHVENASEFKINLHLEIEDAGGGVYRTEELWLVRSRNRLAIPVSRLRTEAGAPLDLSNVRRMRLEIVSPEDFERDVWLFQFRLEEEPPPVVSETERVRFIDFGPLGSPVLPGASLVTEETRYAPWRGCGWTEMPAERASMNCRRLDPVIGDWIFADVSADPAALRVDLPDGKYRARFYGGNYNSKVVPVRSFTLSVDGREVASRAADPETYYTTGGHFAGLEKWYEPDEDPYEKYVRPFYQTHDFSFEATGGSGRFEWQGALAAFALLIAPEGEEFAEAAEAVEAARREDFAENTTAPEPSGELEASEEESARGFILSARGVAGEAGPFEAPPEGERAPESISFRAARGQREIVSLTVTPLRDLGAVELELSAVTSEGGDVLPADSFVVRALKYQWRGWPASLAPSYLYPTSCAPAPALLNRTFYVTCRPGPRQPAGAYRGELLVRTSEGGEAVLPVEVEVRPFRLVRDHEVSYSFWHKNAYNMNYMLAGFLPEKMDYYRRILDAEAESLRRHGFNSWAFIEPTITGVDGEHVELDFSLVEEEVRACRKYGLCDEKHPGLVFTLADLARYLIKETRYGDYLEPPDISSLAPEDRVEEWSDLFVARYVDAVRQIQEFFDERGISVLIYPVDEPRERNINRWNRNLEDTIRYCDLIHETVPGARVFVDPMRDANSGVDYTPLLEHVDVVATHPWERSEKIIEYCREHSEPELWYFNSIMWDRYDFGCQVGAAGAKGFWQWHFQWTWMPFVPFHTGFKWGVTLPGPDGPLDTPDYELVSEAVDDYRYLATLESRIESAERAAAAAGEVAAAKRALGAFYEAAPPYPTREGYRSRPRRPRGEIGGRTLDEWRRVFSRHIEAIDAAAAPEESAVGPAPEPGSEASPTPMDEKIRSVAPGEEATAANEKSRSAAPGGAAAAASEEQPGPEDAQEPPAADEERQAAAEGRVDRFLECVRERAEEVEVVAADVKFVHKEGFSGRTSLREGRAYLRTDGELHFDIRAPWPRKIWMSLASACRACRA